MKRREFIVNSLLTVAGTAVLGACGANDTNKQKKSGQTNRVVTRKFQHLDIPLLSFGCMRLPTINGQIDMEHFEKMADYAMRHGVNYFDTAFMYHGGESENALGRVLSSYKRDSFFLATKNPLRALTSKADVRRIFEEQLRKCRVDYFDFYLAHNISVLTIYNFRSFGVYEELVKLKQEGLIKHLGFSYHGGAELLEEVANEYPWEFCQIQLNYLDWTAMNVRKNYRILTKAKIPVLPMTPLRGGALTRLTGSAAAVLANEAPNDTQASFGLRWVAGRENNFTVLSGMSSLQQMEENVETFVNFRPFTKQEDEIAERISVILQKKGEINCTTCNYCVDCPRGIAIPFIFDAYNEYRATGDAEAFLKRYDSLRARQKADRCIKCNFCNEQCPQLLNIPPLLEKVEETLKNLRAQQAVK
ncbi:MAG: aldo/keto reductase [Endomicrobia bacterium]|nr:aldo/keto reductase [Endomicrobiia bacterium]MCL2506257.1 aldo/keto reductase [Endomicrobiia bacterium]